MITGLLARFSDMSVRIVTIYVVCELFVLLGVDDVVHVGVEALYCINSSLMLL